MLGWDGVGKVIEYLFYATIVKVELIIVVLIRPSCKPKTQIKNDALFSKTFARNDNLNGHRKRGNEDRNSQLLCDLLDCKW